MKSPKSDDESQSASTEPAAPSADVALIRGVSPDGMVHVIRRRGEELEAGALRPLREGAPVHGELVTLHPRPSCPLLCDVQVHYRPPSAAAAPPAPSAPPASTRRKGPAQVATDTYRDNWDSIWRGKKSDALN